MAHERPLVLAARQPARAKPARVGGKPDAVEVVRDRQRAVGHRAQQVRSVRQVAAAKTRRFPAQLGRRARRQAVAPAYRDIAQAATKRVEAVVRLSRGQGRIDADLASGLAEVSPLKAIKADAAAPAPVGRQTEPRIARLGARRDGARRDRQQIGAAARPTK